MEENVVKPDTLTERCAFNSFCIKSTDIES